MTRPALTKRQREILDYVGEHIVAKGYAPSLAEICEHFGLSSMSTAHKHLENLKTKGYIERRGGQSRSATIPAGDRIRDAAPQLLKACEAALWEDVGLACGADLARAILAARGIETAPDADERHLVAQAMTVLEAAEDQP